MPVPSLSVIWFVASLPFRYLFLWVWTLLGKTRFRKYTRRYAEACNLYLVLRIFQFEPSDCYLFAFYDAKFITKWWGRKYFRQLTRSLPSFNQNYGDYAFWIKKPLNRSTDDPILLYLHGGGYKFQLGPGQFKALLVLHELIDAEAAEKLLILVLDYSLACYGAKFPRQKDQLNNVWNQLTQEDGNTNIIPVGDLAGAHLILTYLQELRDYEYHKLYPNIVYPSHMYLISPWIRTLMNPSEEAPPGHLVLVNENRDYLHLTKYNQESVFNIFGTLDMLLLFNDPGRDPIRHSDWDSIPSISDPSRKIFVIVGEDEIFRDDVIEWCNEVLGTKIDPSSFGSSTNSEFIPELHRHHSPEDIDGLKSTVFIEPMGIHDASFLVESETIFGDIQPGGTTLNDIDPDRYFGLYRIAEHLNSVLLPESRLINTMRKN